MKTLMWPEFGIPTRPAKPRLSAFAVIRDGTGKIAVVVEAPGFYSLPGGGLEVDETPPTCLCREVLEECGWRIQVLEELGAAIQYLGVPPYAKESHFYRAIRIDSWQVASERQVLWLTDEEARAALFEESHVWALARSRDGLDDAGVAVT